MRIAAAVVALLALAGSTADAHTLTYTAAKRAGQARADKLAGQPTQVSAVIRQSRHRFFVQARWAQTDPTGCKGCGYDPSTGTVYDTPSTTSCFVNLTVRFRSSTSRRLVVGVRDKLCA